jgi:DNA-binding SARP family transcriptional activator
VKVLTLGRFEIIKDGEPLLFAGKVQKKPLELLKALIAFGCANVPAERLTDALWPDADGDLARKSFEMTLSRLRRLLGEDDFVKYRAGQLSIDLLSCWVDSIAFEHIVGKIKKHPDDQASVPCEKALALYQGPFLSSDVDLHWAAHRRETLKNGLLRTIIITGRHYEATGQWERAVDYYLKGLDTDDLAEEFYQRLMVCYQKLGNNAEAVRIYHRCRSLLEENLGIGPSAGTQAIYSSMLQKP